MIIRPFQIQVQYSTGEDLVAGADKINVLPIIFNNGTVLNNANFFRIAGDMAIFTLDKEFNERMEQLSFSGITDNPNGTYTLTGIKSYTMYNTDPLATKVQVYDSQVGLKYTHTGGCSITFSDNPILLNFLIQGVTAVVTSLNTLIGAITLAGGSNISIVPTGNTLTINSTPTAGSVPTTRLINTTGSLTGGGDLSADRTLQLLGDTVSPGQNKYYGTNNLSAHGYFPIPDIDKYISSESIFTPIGASNGQPKTLFLTVPSNCRKAIIRLKHFTIGASPGFVNTQEITLYSTGRTQSGWEWFNGGVVVNMFVVLTSGFCQIESSAIGGVTVIGQFDADYFT